MNKYFNIFIFAFALTLCFTSCHSLDHEAKRLQTTLNQQIKKAEAMQNDLSQHLQEEDEVADLWHHIDKESNILIYVFDSHGLKFWSDNWLSIDKDDNLFMTEPNYWVYKRFNNAHAVYSWTQSGDYRILTIIPFKYAYVFENEQLHNTFIAPFKIKEKCHISCERQLPNHISINAPNGEYLFSLCENDQHELAPQDKNSLFETISYQSLLQKHERQDTKHPWYATRLFLLLDILVLVVLIIIVVTALIKFKGFKRMTLGRKISYVTLSLLLIFTIYIFTVSTIYVQRRYESGQRVMLENKTRYIKKSLQDISYWSPNLTLHSTHELNNHLSELARTYHTDIHVYDTHGILLGTSSPALFDKGLISKYLAPKPFFSGEDYMMQEEQIGDIQYLCGYAPLYTPTLTGQLQIGYVAIPCFLSEEERMQASNDFASRLFPSILVILILTICITVFLSRTLTKPIRRLTDNMQHFRIGSPNNHLQYTYHDELGQLVEQYNKMVDELEHSIERMALSERETAWRTMARQIAHEINNSLTPMKLTIQQLQRTKKKGDSERFNEYFDKYTVVLIDQINTLSSIAQSFSNFAKMPVVVTKEVNVAQKLFSVITLFRNNQEHIRLRYIGSEDGVIALTDEEQITQVFTNLIKNALQAIENRADGDIIVMLKDLPDAVEISVSDNGCGIPEDIRDKVFRPNFTTKSTGMGLGLAISKNIVEASDGSISFETGDNGTTFFVKLHKP